MDPQSIALAIVIVALMHTALNCGAFAAALATAVDVGIRAALSGAAHVIGIVHVSAVGMMSRHREAYYSDEYFASIVLGALIHEADTVLADRTADDEGLRTLLKIYKEASEAFPDPEAAVLVDAVTEVIDHGGPAHMDSARSWRLFAAVGEVRDARARQVLRLSVE